MFKVLFFITILSLTGIGFGGCGGSGSGVADSSGGGTTTTIPLEVTVSSPTSVRASLSALNLGKKRVTAVDALASGVTCRCQDLDGNEIGTPCVTDETGKCQITGLTSAQIADGVVVLADVPANNGNSTIHALTIPQSTEITTATTTGTAIGVPVNSESDMAYGVTVAACADNVRSCTTAADPACITETAQAVVGDDDPSTDTLGGECEGLFQAHATAIANAPTGTNPADFIKTALGGNPSGFVGVVGESVSGVPVTEAVQNCGRMLTRIRETYCTKSAPTEVSPWQGIRNTASTSFVPTAPVGFFKEIADTTELDEYNSDHIRNYAAALPNLPGAFQMYSSDKGREGLLNIIRSGGMSDSSKAGVALGFLAATFPPPPTAGAYGNIDWTSYDPTVGATAGNYALLDFMDDVAETGASIPPPSQIYSLFNSTFSNTTYMTSCANGGCGTLISNFVASQTNFSPTDHIGEIKQPPGGTCTTSSDCMPCDVCTNSICTTVTAKMGVTCVSDSDCDSITKCVGGLIASLGGRCSCAASMPEGTLVLTTAGGEPGVVGTTVSAPSSGSAGALCSTSNPCSSGYSCTSAAQGVCLPANFSTKAAFAPCAANNECQSGICTSGMCTTLSSNQASTLNSGIETTADQIRTAGTTTTVTGNVGTKSAGEACLSSNECSSTAPLCSLGVCTVVPTFFRAADQTTLKAEGSSCSSDDECTSSYCGLRTSSTAAGTCSGNGAGASGQYCKADANCASGMVCASSACTSSNSSPTLANGSSCTYHGECSSGFCGGRSYPPTAPGTCAALGTGTANIHCSMTAQCLVGLSCINMVCTSF